ncbi:MAG: hypothetical protein M0R03_22325 [Novosphingobium sp.]|nr:hypothetical protein [Novosphingobium sp.]
MEEVNEFRVRAVTRYVVTHYRQSADGSSTSCSSIGNFDNLESANKVGESLATVIPGAKFTPIEDSN